MRKIHGGAVSALLLAVLSLTACGQDSEPAGPAANGHLHYYSVPSGSMENTIHIGDRVEVDDRGRAVRGAVIAFEEPASWGSSADAKTIKRIIGVGGDHVVCCDPQGRISVNGHPLREPYLYPGDKPSIVSFDVRVPEDRLWVMGDHRLQAADSRVHMSDGSQGTIPTSAVEGVVTRIVDPDSRRRPVSVATYPALT